MVREDLVELGASLFDRRPTFGRTGNLSVRSGDGILMTPTGSGLGDLDPGELAELGPDGAHVGGPPPSNEAFLHLAMYRARPTAGETARRFLLLHDHPTRPLTDDQAQQLRKEDP